MALLLAGFARAANPPARSAPARKTAPNIILITLDTTRADRMGFLGSNRGLTPNLDKLARQSAVFTHAYSQVPLTTPSHAAILTGTYPQFNQVRELDAPLSPRLPYLPDLLRHSGYRTAAILASIVFTPKINAEGFDRGFSTYDADFHPQIAGEDRYASDERRAEAVVDRGITWLSRRQPGPFFLWLHFYDPHTPYDPPEPYKTRYSSALYDGEIAYMDSQVGRFLAYLNEQKLFDGAVIAVMADHGEGLGEHGERFHGVFVYDETIHVPLLVKRAQEHLAGRQVGARVSLVDVAPTLLQEAGVALPASMQGKPLQELMSAQGDKGQGWGDRKVYSETEYPKVAFDWSPVYSWRTGKYLYVAAPQPELYDQGLDPGAEYNLATENAAVADTLLSQLAGFQRKTSNAAADSKSQVGHSGAESLAALGYVSSIGIVSRGVEDVKGTDPKTKVEAANMLHKGLEDSQNLDPTPAIEELQQALQQEPNARMAYLALGRCYRRLKDYDKALPALRKAAETMPGLGEAQYELGRTLVEVGKLEEAAPAFQSAVADSPKQAQWHFYLAVVYERTEHVPEATEEFKKTLQLEPNHFRANLLFGRILGMTGKSAEALPYLEKAAKLQPDSAEVHMFLANVYAALKQTSRSEHERMLVEKLKSAQPNE